MLLMTTITYTLMGTGKLKKLYEFVEIGLYAYMYVCM